MLALVALGDAGVPAGDPALGSAAAGCWARRSAGRETGRSRRPGLAPAGWAFEFDNDCYPDIDDTAEVLLALRRVELPGALAADQAAAVERALDWMIGMQSRDGGWGAFDADNTAKLVTKLPFCDFGEVIDPPSADVTAHTVEALAAAGLGSGLAARRGVAWLLRAQEADGSWFGRWGANYVYGTGAVVPALIAAGVRPGKPCIRRAVDLADLTTRTRTAAGARAWPPTTTGAWPGAASRRLRRRRGQCWRCWRRAVTTPCAAP